MVYIVYTLECSKGRFYVGRCPCEELRSRLQRHRQGTGCAFTRVYPAIRILKSRASCDPLDEDKIVLELMRTHGVYKVRGGSYNNFALTDFQVSQRVFLSSQSLSCESESFLRVRVFLSSQSLSFESEGKHSN